MSLCRRRGLGMRMCVKPSLFGLTGMQHLRAACKLASSAPLLFFCSSTAGYEAAVNMLDR